MMGVSLCDGLPEDIIIVPSKVIDEHLREANESQLKIYLYLLRNRNKEVSVSDIADYFNYTESDVERAIRFLKSMKIGVKSISTTKIEKQDVKSEDDLKKDNVVSFMQRESYSPKEVDEFAAQPEIKQFMFVVQQYFVQYLGRMVKPEDIDSFMYFSKGLGFDTQLMEFLIEYCVGNPVNKNQKVTMRQIELTANEWHEAGVKTIEDARRHTMTVPKEMNDVFRAFGISLDREPDASEVRYVRKWTESYGFGMDIIKEACSRTIQQLAKPSFKYANKIIKKWYDEGVHNFEDIKRSDEKYYASMVSDEAIAKKAVKVQQTKSLKSENTTPSATKFSNFKQRLYDYDKLEKDILSN